MTHHHLEQETSSAAEAALAASYIDMLRADPALARETHEALVQAHLDLNLRFDTRLLCNVLRPRFISAERAARLERDSGIVAGVMERAGDVLLGNDRMLDLVWATDAERELWAIDPGYPGFTLSSRLDSFMIDGSPKYVEYNAESPASIGFCDILTEVFLALPAVQQWESTHTLEGFDARRRLMETLLWAYGEWGGRATPSIAIVDWETVVTRRDFELCAEYFRRHGIPAVIADPRRFEYRDGKLWLDAKRIDLVYRRVLLHELLDKAAEATPLLRAYRDGAVCMVNSPRSKLLHKKAVLALLSEHALDLELSGEERTVIDRTIPWTRRLRTGETTYSGRPVDLPSYSLEHRSELVLKPSDDYGGRGVVLGWETTDEEWGRALAAAMGEPYVVQERVSVPHANFPVWRDDGVDVIDLLVDTDPLLFRGEMGGILTRMSGSALLNVTAGAGSTTPTFLVKDEE